MSSLDELLAEAADLVGAAVLATFDGSTWRIRVPQTGYVSRSTYVSPETGLEELVAPLRKRPPGVA